MRRSVGLLITALVVALAPRAGAHDGPPYAILVDHVTGPYRLSVWGDPDVGIGTFLVYLERAGVTTIPEDCRVEIFVQPAERDIPEAAYRAKARKTTKEPRRFDGRVRFDTQGTWRVRFRISSAAGDGEAETVVAVTPPGLGPLLDFALYLFPFAAVGFLFVKAALRRRPVTTARPK